MTRKLLLLNVVGLTPGNLRHLPRVHGLLTEQGSQTQLVPPFPAVTCTSQATLTTGSLPAEHGIVSNGWYFRESAEVRFWMRSDRLVGGEKIWEAALAHNPSLRIANLFWRYATHSRCTVCVTERPTYWANGRKGPDVYTSPGALRDELVAVLGEFPLFRFWGPATSIESTAWIARATAHVMRTHDPHLTLTYLPHLDYDLQKFGPDSPEARRAMVEVDQVASELMQQAVEQGRELVVVSEYGMTAVSQPVYLNRVLREAGYVSVQQAQNGELLEPGACRAFAACSHQSAHIYVADPSDIDDVRQRLERTEGVAQVLDRAEQGPLGLAHPRSGELVAIADRDRWFAYPYWLQDSQAPDFARCVAIHDKPGHDPLEMFLGPGGKRHALRRVVQMKLGLRVPLDVISLDGSKIKGSHGRLPEQGDDAPLLWTSWKSEFPEALPMQQVKPILLSRLLSD